MCGTCTGRCGTGWWMGGVRPWGMFRCMRMRKEGVARMGTDKRAARRPHQRNYRDERTVLCVGSGARGDGDDDNGDGSDEAALK